MRLKSVIFGAFLLASGVLGLFEEQAGLLDWHKGNLGQVTHAQFAFRGRERVFIGSQAGVIASLDTKDGSIVWRQRLEGPVDDLVLIPRPASVLTLSQGQSSLRCWQALDGGLLWEKAISGPSSFDGGLQILSEVSGDASRVLVYSSTSIQVLSAANGAQIWSNGDFGGQLLKVAAHGEDTLEAIINTDGTCVSLTLEASSGAQISSQPLTTGCTDTASSPEFNMAVAADQLVYKKHGESTVKELSLGKSTGDGVHDAIRLGKFAHASQLTVYVNDQLHLINLDATEPRLQQFPGVQLATGAVSPSEVTALAGVTPQGGLTAAFLDATLRSVGEEYAIDASLITVSGEAMQARQLFVGSTSGAAPSPNKLRILVEVSDDSLWLLEDGQVKWHREEALASIRHAFFVDLPPSTADLALTWSSNKPSLVERMNAEVLTLKKVLGYSQPEDDAVLKDISLRMSTSQYPYRDANGFRKLIVAATSSGKLLGLHSGQGNIVWQTNVGQQRNLSRLLLWQTPWDLSAAPKLLAIGSSGGQTSAVIVDAHSGKLIQDFSFTGTVSKILQLPHFHADKAEQHAYALIFDDLSVQVLPAADRAAFPKIQAPLHFWRREGDQLTGHKLDNLHSRPQQLWETAFTAPHNALLKVIAPDPQEPIYSYAKVLGNRDMKLKFLNRNTVFAISGAAQGGLESSQPLLTAQLIDTITGQVLYSQTLPGARGPVSGVWSENWVVYSYYSIANHRSEVAVLEFYEAQPQAYSIPALLFGSQNSSYSSLAPASLQVLYQSYWSQLGVKSMAVTTTRKGITSKQLLLATDTDQVYLLDKRFVDPRRPKGTPKKEDEAEMLPPYSEELLFLPHQYATHKETVDGLKEIAVEPANLESTTLALAFGIDLFFTRIQPSKTFDLLPDDFPYAMLVLVFVTLSVGSYVLRHIDEQRVVKRKWA